MRKDIGAIILVFALALVIFSINSVSADHTTVSVVGMKGFVWNITLNVVNPSTGDLIASVDNDTDAATGIAKFYYDSATQMVTYSVIARNNGRIVADKTTREIGNWSTGVGSTVITLVSVTPSTAHPAIVINTSDASDSADSSDANVSSSGNATTINLGTSFMSGTFAKIKSGLAASWKWIVYVILGLIVIAGIVFGVIWWMKRRPQKPYEFLRKSEDLIMSGDNERQVSRSNRMEEELASAEQKIKEAQEEITKIKNRKNKLEDAKHKFEQAKQELESAKEEVEGEY